MVLVNVEFLDELCIINYKGTIAESEKIEPGIEIGL
jgi:hypothetical protein